MATSVSSSFKKYQVEVTCTPLQYIERGLGRFKPKLKPQPSMSLFGHSGMGGTRTVYPLHGMCCFEECYWVPPP